MPMLQRGNSDQRMTALSARQEPRRQMIDKARVGAALGNEGGSGGTSVGRRPARLLDANRGFDARLSGGGSYEGQCRSAFLRCRQENISERTPRLLGRTVLCRLCNESGGSEVWDPHSHELTCSVMCIAGT